MVLAQSTRLRMELAAIPGPGWRILPEPCLETADEEQVGYADDPIFYRDLYMTIEHGGAWLPCDPTAIVVRAAEVADEPIAALRRANWQWWAGDPAWRSAVDRTSYGAALQLLASAMGEPWNEGACHE